MPNKTVKLTTPVELHGKLISEIELREPNGGLFLEYGEPVVVSQTREGTRFVVEDREAIRGYLDKIVCHENGADVIKLMTLADVKKTKDTLLSFFDGAAETSE